MSIKPTVSIICLTYNQVKYVRDCFEGFVMQQTNFSFEVLVYDDASTDGTSAIIEEYAAKYPNIFKPTLYKENNYSKGLGYVGLYTGIKEAKGKYVAYCEGDDYWTDPLKLQKQVDFLEAHPEYEICAHETLIKFENIDNKQILFSQTDVNIFLDRRGRREYTFKDTLTGNIFHISAMMYRNFDLQLPKWMHEISAGDMVLFTLLAKEGKIYVMPDVMSVYRHHAESLTTSTAEYQTAIPFLQLSINVLLRMNEYWERRYENLIYPIIARYYVRMEFVYLSKSARDYAKAKAMAKEARRYSWLTYCKYQIIESYYKVMKHL